MLGLDNKVTRVETCSIASARRVAAMLDLDPDTIVEGEPLPRGWQFMLLGADTRRSALRSDGFPGLGVAMPDLGLPRLVLGGRTVVYHADLPVGSTVRRTSGIKSLTRKSTESGPMAVMTIVHELQVANDAPAIVETQTYLLMAPRPSVADKDSNAPPVPVAAERMNEVVPDETMLFQYSALGFNSHKIHSDRDYAREVEGFPDLVVNGGLTTLLLTEFLRRSLGCNFASIKARYVAPLYCGRRLTLAADRDGAGWRLKAFDDRGRSAVDMEVDVQ